MGLNGPRRPSRTRAFYMHRSCCAEIDTPRTTEFSPPHGGMIRRDSRYLIQFDNYISQTGIPLKVACGLTVQAGLCIP